MRLTPWSRLTDVDKQKQEQSVKTKVMREQQVAWMRIHKTFKEWCVRNFFCIATHLEN